MNKGRYVNFASKKKFKNRSASVKGKQCEEQGLSKIDSAKGKQGGKQFGGKPARSKLKFSVKEEELEIERLLQLYQDTNDPKEVTTFNSFPLSKKTLTGLKEAGYVKPTEIQRNSILAGLRGEDVLAAAKTGSGKTLAFLIPVIERLYTQKWTRMDGLGGLIITPTRELALQIFETMGQIGRHHDITTGLIIGGQNLKNERNLLHNLNIMIGTPGRLLQHMDQNPLFDATNLKVLVLDEADRCLDLGFASAMDAIIQNLPPTRQTLLFSATQTNSVRDLARVNLTNPRHIAPHEDEAVATPVKLQQSYVVVELHEKLIMLWSFLRTHPKQKIIVFFATCKQVKYFYQILKKLRPSNLLLPLYGGMNQEKRNKIYAEFCSKRANVCLLATDVASRGLDFPRVNWVVQIDCPEDVTQYIHRAGRTARLNMSGENLLVVTPHEMPAMLESLVQSKIPIKQIRVDERQLFSPLVKIQSLLAQSPELKECAKRAFVAYIKSVAIMKNGKVFQLEKLNLDEYAKSLGLNVTPRVRFLSRTTSKLCTEKSKIDSACIRGEYDQSGEEQSDDEEFLTVKRIEHEYSPQKDAEQVAGGCSFTADPPTESINSVKKRISKAKKIKKSLEVAKRTMFNDEGVPVTDDEPDRLAQPYDINAARLQLQSQDAADKERYKQLKKAKRNAQKEKDRKRKAERNLDGGSEFDSDGSVDLDWLPDPDRIYPDKKQHLSPLSEDKSDEEETNADGRAKTKNGFSHKAMNLTLNEAEQLAMNLLL